MSFSHSTKAALDQGGRYSPIPFCGLGYKIQLKPEATSNMELFVTKIGNEWRLLLTAVTKSFVLNVAGLLDLTLNKASNILKSAASIVKFENI